MVGVYYAQRWVTECFTANATPRVYPDRDGNEHACADWEAEGMNQDMYLLGSILLHEYT